MPVESSALLTHLPTNGTTGLVTASVIRRSGNGDRPRDGSEVACIPKRVNASG